MMKGSNALSPTARRVAATALVAVIVGGSSVALASVPAHASDVLQVVADEDGRGHSMSGEGISADDLESLVTSGDVVTSGSCSDSGKGTVTWSLTKNSDNSKPATYTLAIEGSGAMSNFKSAYDTPWGAYLKSTKEGADGKLSIAITKITIGKEVADIGDCAFRETGVTEVEIPGTVKTLGSRVFQLCPNLKKITVGEGVQGLGSSFCQSNPALESVSLPASLTTIGSAPFRECPELNEIKIGNGSQTSNHAYKVNKNELVDATSNTLKAVFGLSKKTDYSVPEGIVVIDPYVLSKFANLTSVTLPESLTTIGKEAFSYDTGLKSIDIGKNVRIIDSGAFKDCSLELNVAEENKYYSSDNGILYDFNKSQLIAYPTSITSESFTVPDTVTDIQSGAFANNTSLKSVTFGSSVRRIGSTAFLGCNNLTSATFNEGLESIQDSAFDGTALVSVELPDSVSMLGEYAFRTSGNAGKYATTYFKAGTGLKQIGKSAVCVSGDFSPKVIIDLSRVSSLDNVVAQAIVTSKGGGTNGNHQVLVQNSVVLKTLSDTNAISGANAVYVITNGGVAANPQTGEKLPSLTRGDGEFSKYVVKSLGAVLDNHKNIKDHQVGADINAFCSGGCVTAVEAVWNYTLTFDSNGGSLAGGSANTLKVLSNQTLADAKIVLPVPTKNGFGFAGWNTQPDGQGKQVGNEFQADKSMTLYAMWGKAAGDYTIVPVANQVYTGKELRPCVYLYKDGAYTKADNVTYSNNVEVGTAKATITIDGQTYETSFTIDKATPKLSIAVTPDNLNGGGQVTISVDGAPEGADVTVTCSDDTIYVTKGDDDNFHVTLPNTSKTYTFTAKSMATDNYLEVTSAEAKVTVTHKSSGGNGGGGSVTPMPSTNAVETPAVDGGSVKTDADKAKVGDTVTVTVAPDSQHRAYGVDVKDASGKALEVTKNADGTYSFVMPSSKVTVTPVFANNFPDANYDQWYGAALDFVSAKGIMGGYPTGDFGVGKTLTRAELAQLLYNYSGETANPAANNETGMADVEDGEWYTAAANWAVEHGVFNGYSNPDGTKTFGAYDPVTLEQLAAVIANLEKADVTKADASKLDGFKDVGTVNSWAEQSIAWAVQSGLVNGSFEQDGKYIRPTQDIARERVAAVVMNAINKGIMK